MKARFDRSGRRIQIDRTMIEESDLIDIIEPGTDEIFETCTIAEFCEANEYEFEEVVGFLINGDQIGGGAAPRFYLRFSD